MASYYWNSISSTDPTNSANWTKSDGTTGTVPTTGDDVFIVPIAGLALASIGAADQHTIALNSLNVSQGYAGTIGTSAAPGGYWQIGAAVLNLGIPVLDNSGPQGSGRIKINLGSTSSVVNVYNTGSLSTDIGFQPTRILGTAITTINVSSGNFGLATNAPGEVSTVTTINVTGNLSGTGSVATCGTGVTWTTGTAASGGTLNVASAGTTLTTSSGGTALATGTGLIGTVNAGGTTQLNNRVGGTDVTTLNLYSTGTADFSGNPSASTIATLNLTAGGALITDAANPDHVTVTTLHKINGGRLSLS